ncbi:uncharacterized protein ATNIH1004_011120 [Aspergillus tanneri]|uniref:Uncharacterized protein n=1 Tax=Aspergillus tanneri TaxID=1220188 RepID=A0A5M9MCB5_9EURO|nr:uncharacterized protein ATNIH1004_011120 [Aspergillus tanneri]KAA8642179.1 hypothetical protein ATNIH1004_011120 [Aspergillus tanneri]
MRLILNILALLVGIASGHKAFNATIFTLDQSFYPQDWSLVLSDDVVQRLLELRMGLSSTSALKESDEDTVELLNKFGGLPTPLFSSDTDKSGFRRNLLILEGLEAGVVSFIQQELHQNLHGRVPSDFLSPLFMPAINEAESDNRSSMRPRHCAFRADRQTPPVSEQTLQQCVPEGSVFEQLPRLFNRGFLDQASMTESWTDAHISSAALRISFKVPLSPVPLL